MFKFLKSKKGFTLVELMIVVVIMAILVAVAVPIYSAVTANARKKTCVNNQRDVVSAINTTIMNDPGSIIVAIGEANKKTITINTNAAGDGLATGTGDAAGIIDSGVFDTTGAKFKTLFEDDNMPFCPTKDGQVIITVTRLADDSYDIDTDCQIEDNSHVAATPAA